MVSVNGESVMCKSYAEVVGMIQKSGPTLNLVVLPKEHDILQQVTYIQILLWTIHHVIIIIFAVFCRYGS